MAPLQGQAMGAQIQHFTHPSHHLQKVHIPTHYNCDGCNTPGFGKRYRCTAACDFDLQEQCATTTSPLTVLPSHVHPQHHQLAFSAPPEVSCPPAAIWVPPPPSSSVYATGIPSFVFGTNCPFQHPYHGVQTGGGGGAVNGSNSKRKTKMTAKAALSSVFGIPSGLF